MEGDALSTMMYLGNPPPFSDQAIFTLAVLFVSLAVGRILTVDGVNHICHAWTRRGQRVGCSPSKKKRLAWGMEEAG